MEILSAAMSHYGTVAKLDTIRTQLQEFANKNEHAAMYEIEQRVNSGDTSKLVMHIDICSRKCPLTFTIKKAHEIYKSLFDEYGKRALAAETNQGVDWKALSHAVRVARECVELLDTGHITFPRPECAHLIAIKTGALDYKVVAEEIEMLLPAAEAASARSTLRADPDREWIDYLVTREYKKVVDQWRA